MVVASLEILVVFHRLSRDIGLFKPQQDLPSCCWTSSGRESVMEQKTNLLYKQTYYLFPERWSIYYEYIEFK